MARIQVIHSTIISFIQHLQVQIVAIQTEVLSESCDLKSESKSSV